MHNYALRYFLCSSILKNKLVSDNLHTIIKMAFIFHLLLLLLCAAIVIGGELVIYIYVLVTVALRSESYIAILHEISSISLHLA